MRWRSSSAKRAQVVGWAGQVYLTEPAELRIRVYKHLVETTLSNTRTPGYKDLFTLNRQVKSDLEHENLPHIKAVIGDTKRAGSTESTHYARLIYPCQQILCHCLDTDFSSIYHRPRTNRNICVISQYWKKVFKWVLLVKDRWLVLNLR